MKGGVLGHPMIRRNQVMQTATTIGLDLAKSVFQVHGIDRDGNVVLRRRTTFPGIPEISVDTQSAPYCVLHRILRTLCAPCRASKKSTTCFSAISNSSRRAEPSLYL